MTAQGKAKLRKVPDITAGIMGRRWQNLTMAEYKEGKLVRNDLPN